MRISTVLFDLDGTLLPLNQDEFVKKYFTHLAAFLAPPGYAPAEFTKALWSGVTAMTKNDGRAINETVFWEDFARFYGDKAQKDMPLFDTFYRDHFVGLKSICSCNPRMREVIGRVKSAGCTVVVATNPVFPATATEQRIRWAGLNPEDFRLITTYENSRFSKPNPKYYEDLLTQLGVAPEECLMIGNDTLDDMIAESLGIKVFLLTDCLVNRQNKDVNAYPHGDVSRLMEYLDEML